MDVVTLCVVVVEEEVSLEVVLVVRVVEVGATKQEHADDTREAGYAET